MGLLQYIAKWMQNLEFWQGNCRRYLVLLLIGCFCVGAEQMRKEDSVPPAAFRVEEKLSAEEIVLASKMRDQYRRLFAEKFSVEERKAIITSIQEGMAPDDAVEKFCKK